MPILHAKYWNHYFREKAQLANSEFKLKQLTFDKTEFYMNGETKETRAAGWIHPQRKIARSELQQFLDVDKGIVEVTQRVSIQRDKVDYIKSILSTIANRGYLLKTILDHQRFQAGSY